MMQELRSQQLYKHCNEQALHFKTTDELEDKPLVLGQDRASEAIQFGVNVPHEGYNIFALGPAGTGKHFLVDAILRDQASKQTTPADCCYINNFAETNKPKLLLLPSGSALRLKEDIAQLLEDIANALPATFESDEYQARRKAIDESFQERSDERFQELDNEAQSRSIATLRTPMGVMFAPFKNKQPVSTKEFSNLPKEEQTRFRADIAALQEKLQAVLRELPRLERERHQQIRELDREVTQYAIGHLIEELKQRYQNIQAVVQYLDALQADMTEHARELLQDSDGQAETKTPLLQRRYGINVLVEHSKTQGAPVVFEDNPTFQNLIGRIEHMAQMGTLVTDFNLIKAGALHRANGGYLIVDARKLLQQPYAWDGLKRALKSRQIRIESLGEALSLISTVSLEPESVPLNVKVVFLGDRLLYYLLCAYDPEFSELFKVQADFEDDLPRTSENEQHYATLMATIIHHEGLRTFERDAVAKVIEHNARLAGDTEKLSTHTEQLTDLLREASYWSSRNEHNSVTSSDVERALEAQRHRADRIYQHLREEMLRGILFVDTEGSKVGQVNGLSVYQLGNFTFGKPSRITARVRLGKGEVIDIEREVELGGPIHSKGVLILAAYLGSTYAQQRPLSLSASLVFEQSYGGVEGDSASAAELYALLSAIADVPIKQAFAITGSVNQHGEIQPIGGVNEKIEGFFELCKARGLSDEQGVIIPAANLKHLMLHQDVIEAVAAGKFHIYAINHIADGIELLTGLKAGERDTTGKFSEGTFNFLVDKRLAEMTETQLKLAKALQESHV